MKQTKQQVVDQIIERAVKHDRAGKDRERGAELLTVANKLIRGAVTPAEALKQAARK